MMSQRKVVFAVALGSGLLAVSTAWASKDLNLQATWGDADIQVQPQKQEHNFNVMEDLIVEDFESGMPESWFLDTFSGSPGWLAGDATDASSAFWVPTDHTNFAFVNSDEPGQGVEMDDWMITDLFDLPEDLDGAFLVFETTWHEGSGAEQGWGEVMFAHDGGDWEQIYDMNANGDIDGAWNEIILDLADFAGSSFCQIGFHYYDTGNWSYGWGIDDLNIFTTAGDEFPPEISTVPYYVHMDFNSGFDIEAELTDASGVQHAEILYRIGGGDWISIDMLPVAGDTWAGTVPGIGNVGMVEWKISATDFSEAQNSAESGSFFTEVNNETWLHYDVIGDSNNGVGSPIEAWNGAVLFDPGTYPITLTEIEMGGFNNDVAGDMTMDLRIWDADGTDGEPGTELFAQDGVTHVNADFGSWEMDTPLVVEGPFFVGGEFIANHRVYVDQPGYFWENTSWLAIGGEWDVMENFAITDNFMIHVYGEFAVDVAVERQEILPRNMQLVGSYPNPFNPSTEISIDLANTQHVTLNIYNVMGELVETLHNGMLPAGNNTLTWNAGSKASGVYMAILSNGVQQEAFKLTLVR